MEIFKTTALLLSLAGLLTPRTMWASSKSGKASILDKTIITVNGEPILQSEIEGFYQLSMESDPKKKSQLSRRDVVRELLKHKVMTFKAKKMGIKVEKNEVNRILQDYILEAGSAQRLVQYMNKPVYEIKQEIKKQLMVQNMTGQVINNVGVTPAEVRDYYQHLTAKQKQEQVPAQLICKQLIVYPLMNKAKEEKLIDQLKKIKKRIEKKGEGFGEMAKQYSQEKATKFTGGTIGTFGLGELDPDYEAAALKLKPGKISKTVVKTKHAYHLIKLNSREGNQYNTSHILLYKDTKEQQLKEAILSLEKIRTGIITGETTYDKSLKKLLNDKTGEGGFLVNREGKTRVVLKELPQEILEGLKKLQPGGITMPRVYTNPKKEQVARMLFVNSKIPAHRIGLKYDFEVLKERAIMKKKETKFSEFLSKAEKEANVVILDPTYRGISVSDRK